MNVVIVFAMLCCEPFATFNCTASPKGGRRHLPRRTGRNRRAVRSIRRRNAPPRMDGYKGGGIRRRGYHGRREFAGIAASLPATLHRSAPADPHSNSPGSVARSARPAADFRALRVNRDRQKRRAVARHPDNRRPNALSAWLDFAKYSAPDGYRPAGYEPPGCAPGRMGRATSVRVRD